MAVVRVRGIKRYRHPVSGILYIYHRKSGLRIRALEGTSEFFAELAAAEASSMAPVEPRPGTLGVLIRAYRASHYFAGLAPRSRSDYDKVLNYLADLDGLPLAEIDGAFVARLRDRIFSQRKRRFANYCLAVLSVVMEVGRELGAVALNPVRGVRRVRRGRDEPNRNRPWTTVERAIVIDRAPDQLKLPLAIGRWTGLREGDVLRLAKGDYDGVAIRLRTAKRGVPAVIPVARPLKVLLDRPQASAAESDAAPPTALTLCATTRGHPWTGSGFRASLFKFLRRLEAEGAIGPGLTFHGLRHSVATDLAELGYDDRTIADMLAQESEEMPAHYSRHARLEKKLRGVVQKMERAQKR